MQHRSCKILSMFCLTRGQCNGMKAMAVVQILQVKDEILGVESSRGMPMTISVDIEAGMWHRCCCASCRMQMYACLP